MVDQKYALDQATVVLFNPLSQMRATLRDAMLVIGFRNILDYGDLERARNAIIERAPDLVLLDLDREREAVCELVREVRHSRLCADPFMVIIALSWHPSIEAVNNSMEAGIDDIITMPLSIKLITARLNTLIWNRKNFVVTSTYVGPDRRNVDRTLADPLSLGTIKVPNNLRFKTTGDAEFAASNEAVSAVQAHINNHRLNRYAQRIAWLVDEALKSRAEGTETERMRQERYEETSHLIDDLAYELEAQGHMALMEICDSMARVQETLNAAPSKQLYELLKVHALAITATLLEREGAAELVVEALNNATAKVKRAQTA